MFSWNIKLLVEWPPLRESFKVSNSQDVFKLHMEITLQAVELCSGPVRTICFHVMNDLAKWNSVLLLDWLQDCFSIEIILTITI